MAIAKTSRKHFIFRTLLVLFVSLLVSGAFYSILVFNGISMFPNWLTVQVFPFLVTTLCLIWLGNAIFEQDYYRCRSHRGQMMTKFAVYLIMGSIGVGLFFPLSQSLRYNLGKTEQMESLADMKRYEQPIFLSVNDFYADRIRVLPFNTFEKVGIFGSEVKVKTFFLVPLFPKATAYREHAKAWMGFTYEKRISKKEFVETQGKPYFKDFYDHFKKINVMGFLYFERYDEGKEWRIFQNLVKAHSYFKSGYSTVYFGQSVDRDLISLRFFLYFLGSFVIIAIPAIIGLAFMLFQDVHLERNS